MIPVRHHAVQVDFDGSRAHLFVRDLDVFDDHDLANSLTQGLGLPTPPIPGVFPVRANVSFDVEWDGSLAMAQIENTAQHFKGDFLSTGATIRWSAEQPGFLFQSDMPPDPKANLVSVLGREQNGVFFSGFLEMLRTKGSQPLQKGRPGSRMCVCQVFVAREQRGWHRNAKPKCWVWVCACRNSTPSSRRDREVRLLALVTHPDKYGFTRNLAGHQRSM